MLVSNNLTLVPCSLPSLSLGVRLVSLLFFVNSTVFHCSISDAGLLFSIFPSCSVATSSCPLFGVIFPNSLVLPLLRFGNFEYCGLRRHMHSKKMSKPCCLCFPMYMAFLTGVFSGISTQIYILWLLGWRNTSKIYRFSTYFHLVTRFSLGDFVRDLYSCFVKDLLSSSISVCGLYPWLGYSAVSTHLKIGLTATLLLSMCGGSGGLTLVSPYSGSLCIW